MITNNRFKMGRRSRPGKRNDETDKMQEAFAALQRCIPHIPHTQSLPKVKILRLAFRYIKHLQDILEENTMFRPAFSNQFRPLQMEDFASTAMAEVQARNSYKERADKEIQMGISPENICRKAAKLSLNVYIEDLPQHQSDENDAQYQSPSTAQYQSPSICDILYNYDANLAQPSTSSLNLLDYNQHSCTLDFQRNLVHNGNSNQNFGEINDDCQEGSIILNNFNFASNCCLHGYPHLPAALNFNNNLIDPSLSTNNFSKP